MFHSSLLHLLQQSDRRVPVESLLKRWESGAIDRNYEPEHSSHQAVTLNTESSRWEPQHHTADPKIAHTAAGLGAAGTVPPAPQPEPAPASLPTDPCHKPICPGQPIHPPLQHFSQTDPTYGPLTGSLAGRRLLEVSDASPYLAVLGDGPCGATLCESAGRLDSCIRTSPPVGVRRHASQVSFQTWLAMVLRSPSRTLVSGRSLDGIWTA